MDSLRVLILTFSSDDGVVESFVSGYVTPAGSSRPCRIYTRRENGKVSTPVFIGDDIVDGTVAVEAWGRKLIGTQEMVVPASAGWAWSAEETIGLVNYVFGEVDYEKEMLEEVDCFDPLPSLM